jgi:hypothetical protein
MAHLTCAIEFDFCNSQIEIAANPIAKTADLRQNPFPVLSRYATNVLT